MTTLETLRAALDALERVSLVDDILSPSLCGAVNNSAADLRTLIAAMEKSEPFAWAIHYKDSAESHGVVLDTDRELAISRCEDCMGNGVESYSLPVPLYTHAQPVEQPLKEPVGNAQSLTDDLMDCVDRLGSEAETVDPRVWDHLRVYFPVQPIKQHKPTGWVSPKGHYAVPVLFNPYTGEPRDVRNVASDPQGILIVPPGKVEMLAAKKPQSIEPPSTCGACKHFKQGKNPAVGVYEMACFECSQYYPDKYESRAIEQAIRSKQA